MKSNFRKVIVLCIICLVSALCAIGCNQGGDDNKNFTTIKFDSVTLDYDGESHTIEATGIPSGATVNYTGAGPYVNAGEYDISLSVSATGYNTYNKTVKLKINKIDYPSDVVFKDKKVVATGGEKIIEVTGGIPTNTQITYTNNKGTTAGTYNAVATLKNPNYNDLTLTATLTIVDIISTAKETVDSLLTRPDPWSFMPEAFKVNELACETNPLKDFSSFVNVNSINKKFMGQQMYVLWEGVHGTEQTLKYFDMVYAVGEAIALAYQNFINANPDNCAEWTNEVAGFKVKILLNGKKYTMLVGNATFSIELYADIDNNINKGRIEIAQGGILNYEMTDDYLKFNIALNIKGVMAMKQVEFVRNEDGAVSGYFYEYLGLKAVAIKTSAVIAFNENYAIVTSAKRESDDLIIEGYEEVYSAKTGEFLGAEVVENNKLTDFDTFWVNAYDVTGITSIKALENENVLPNENSNFVYVNGSNEIFKAVKNKLFGIETSRKYDIEMKTVYYVVETVNGEDVEYSVVETEVPMVFVQKKNVSDFGGDITKANENTFDTTPTLPSTRIAIAELNFANMQQTLNTIKELLTYDELVNQLGTRNSFFDTVS